MSESTIVGYVEQSLFTFCKYNGDGFMRMVLVRRVGDVEVRGVYFHVGNVKLFLLVRLQ